MNLGAINAISSFFTEMKSCLIQSEQKLLGVVQTEGKRLERGLEYSIKALKLIKINDKNSQNSKTNYEPLNYLKQAENLRKTVEKISREELINVASIFEKSFSEFEKKLGKLIKRNSKILNHNKLERDLLTEFNSKGSSSFSLKPKKERILSIEKKVKRMIYQDKRSKRLMKKRHLRTKSKSQKCFKSLQNSRSKITNKSRCSITPLKKKNYFGDSRFCSPENLILDPKVYFFKKKRSHYKKKNSFFNTSSINYKNIMKSGLMNLKTKIEKCRNRSREMSPFRKIKKKQFFSNKFNPNLLNSKIKNLDFQSKMNGLRQELNMFLYSKDNNCY